MKGDSGNMIQDGRGQLHAYCRKERLARLVWSVVCLLLFRPVPRIFNPWHRGTCSASLGRTLVAG